MSSKTERLHRASTAVRRVEKKRKINPIDINSDEYKKIYTHFIPIAFNLDVSSADQADYWTNLAPDNPVTLQTACLRMKINGVTHEDLARHMVLTNPKIMAALALASLKDAQVKSIIETLANAIFEYYPQNYKDEWEKKRKKSARL